MVAVSSFSIIGYKDKPVPCSFYRQSEETRHLAVVYPGYGYTVDMPVLYYPTRLLLEMGADVMQVQYPYVNQPEYLQALDEEQYVWLYTDSFNAMEEAWKQRRYSQLTLVGKSLGSMAAAHVAASNGRLAKVSCIFITPTLNDHQFVNDLLDAAPRSLFVIGTDDRHYNAETLHDLEKSLRTEALVFRGANHSLEIKNNLSQSLQIIDRMLRTIEVFIREANLE